MALVFWLFVLHHLCQFVLVSCFYFFQFFLDLLCLFLLAFLDMFGVSAFSILQLFGDLFNLRLFLFVEIVFGLQILLPLF